MSFGDRGLCVLLCSCYFRCCQGCAFLPEMGLCRRGSVVLPLPLGWELVELCGQQGSVHPGRSRAVLEGPGALQAGTGASIPRLPSLLPGWCLWALSLCCSLANNTREEASCCHPELTAGAVPP